MLGEPALDAGPPNDPHGAPEGSMAERGWSESEKKSSESHLLRPQRPSDLDLRTLWTQNIEERDSVLDPKQFLAVSLRSIAEAI